MNGERNQVITEAMLRDESAVEFREFQAELTRFNESLRESIEQARRGEARPLDVEQLKAEICAELALERIAD